MNENKPPKIIYSILTGGIILPIFSIFIQLPIIKNNNIYFIGILLFGILIPIFLSTGNIKYIVNNYKEENKRKKDIGIFRFIYIHEFKFKKETFKEFYIPAWKRLTIIFISFVITVLIAKILLT